MRDRDHEDYTKGNVLDARESIFLSFQPKAHLELLDFPLPRFNRSHETRQRLISANNAPLIIKFAVNFRRTKASKPIAKSTVHL